MAGSLTHWDSVVGLETVAKHVSSPLGSKASRKQEQAQLGQGVMVMIPRFHLYP